MKKLILIFLLLPSFLFANPYEGNVTLVILDAGHGGKDSGAIYEDIYEKDIVLEVIKKIDKILNDEGVETVLTRSDDSYLTLQERADIANIQSFDLSGYPIFVSIHANSFASPSAQGFEVFVKKEDRNINMISPISSNEMILKYSSYTNKQLNAYLNTVNKSLSQNIIGEVSKSFNKMHIRGLKEEDFWVLNASFMPAVLIELGFLSNENDRSNLLSSSWQNKMAKSIASAILSFT